MLAQRHTSRFFAAITSLSDWFHSHWSFCLGKWNESDLSVFYGLSVQADNSGDNHTFDSFLRTPGNKNDRCKANHVAAIGGKLPAVFASDVHHMLFCNPEGKPLLNYGSVTVSPPARVVSADSTAAL